MAKLRRTLLIGLGGTGIKAILNAKKMFYENYGEIPPMIGFIGIDTDKPGLSNASEPANDGKKISLSNSEQLCISVEDPIQIYLQNRNSPVFDWMPTSNVDGLTALSIGAGQIRSNGRFALTVNEKTVEQYIRHKINEVNNAKIIDNAKYDLLGKDTEVHMVFSLGGGTGSGTFLNTAYLIKRLFPKLKISGYAVLPEIFRAMAGGPLTKRVKPNGKGAIIDLDYLNHLTLDTDPVEIKWFRNSLSVYQRPFEALYFIDNKNENNDTFNNLNPLTQMIALAIVTSVGELGVALDSVSDNVSKLIADGTMDIKNKKAWVAGFGCAEIIFDGKRLASIYERKATVQLINKMLNGGCDDPVIIANNWFDDTHIRENLGKDDVIDYFMSPKPSYLKSDLDSPDNPLPECDRYINTTAMESQSKLDEKLTKLEEKVDEKLTRLLYDQANRECGIYLCQQILLSILHQTELCDVEMKEEKEGLEELMPRLESALTTACKELEECMSKLFKRGRKDLEEEVLNQTMQIAEKKREIVRRTMARRFYSWLKQRVNQSIDRVDIIIKNLQTVRNECNEEIQKYLRTNSGANFFQFDLSADYAGKVECPMDDIVFNDFSHFMLPEGGVAALTGLTSLQTKETLLRFIRTLPRVKEYDEMSVDDALAKLPEKEIKYLLSRAIKKSLPLLSYSYRGFDRDLEDEPVSFYYVAIDNEKKSPLVENNLFKELVPGAKDVQFSEVGLKDRIIIYRQLGVLPAFTIHALDGLELEYEDWESKKPLSSHWDAKLCERMKKERFSLLPKTTPIGTLETWINAIVYDLIKYNAETGQYQIRSRGMGGKALRNFLVNMGASRKEAFQYLEDNIDVLDPEIKKAIHELDIPGPENPAKVLTQKAIKACENGTYLQDVSKCPITLENIEHYPDEENLIEKEIEYILDHIAQ